MLHCSILVLLPLLDVLEDQLRDPNDLGFGKPYRKRAGHGKITRVTLMPQEMDENVWGSSGNKVVEASPGYDSAGSSDTSDSQSRKILKSPLLASDVSSARMSPASSVSNSSILDAKEQKISPTGMDRFKASEFVESNSERTSGGSPGGSSAATASPMGRGRATFLESLKRACKSPSPGRTGVKTESSMPVSSSLISDQGSCVNRMGESSSGVPGDRSYGRGHRLQGLMAACTSPGSPPGVQSEKSAGPVSQSQSDSDSGRTDRNALCRKRRGQIDVKKINNQSGSSDSYNNSFQQDVQVEREAASGLHDPPPLRRMEFPAPQEKEESPPPLEMMDPSCDVSPTAESLGDLEALQSDLSILQQQMKSIKSPELLKDLESLQQKLLLSAGKKVSLLKQGLRESLGSEAEREKEMMEVSPSGCVKPSVSPTPVDPEPNLTTASKSGSRIRFSDSQEHLDIM